VKKRPLVWTIVVGGGSSTRFGRLKQFELLGDERVIDRSRRIAESVSDGVVLVVPAGDAVRERAIAGGATRSASVRAGLAAVPVDADIICVHDAARPLATSELYRAAIDAIEKGADGALPGIAVTDSIKSVNAEGIVIRSLDRTGLVAAQTPQVFRADMLRRAHEANVEGTDDAAAVELIGGRIVVIEGEPDNRKITHLHDLDWVRMRLGVERTEAGE
jgi:2-C-methyl-D-erythritol 4-phosphate cytidylyltransferase